MFIDLKNVKCFKFYQIWTSQGRTACVSAGDQASSRCIPKRNRLSSGTGFPVGLKNIFCLALTTCDIIVISYTLYWLFCISFFICSFVFMSYYVLDLFLRAAKCFIGICIVFWSKKKILFYVFNIFFCFYLNFPHLFY